VTTTSISLAHHVDEVFAVVADPRTYPHWLLGARDIRSLDPTWPAPGSGFRHKVGLIGPLKIPDRSTVVEVDPPHRLVLEVRARPLLRARVAFDLAPGGTSSGRERTLLAMTEEPVRAYRWVAPLLEPLIAARNRRSLGHLADLLATGTSHRAPG
jgi:hypothetical protein